MKESTRYDSRHRTRCICESIHHVGIPAQCHGALKIFNHSAYNRGCDPVGKHFFTS